MVFTKIDISSQFIPGFGETVFEINVRHRVAVIGIVDRLRLKCRCRLVLCIEHGRVVDGARIEIADVARDHKANDIALIRKESAPALIA